MNLLLRVWLARMRGSCRGACARRLGGKAVGTTASTMLLVVLLALAGCGQKHEENDGHGHAEKTDGGDEHGHDAGNPGASYEEGKGIVLQDETREAIGLELAEAVEREIRPKLEATAQVYRAANEPPRSHGGERAGYAYATALIPAAAAEGLKPGSRVDFVAAGRAGETRVGTLWKVDLSQVPLLGKAEALLELSDPDHGLKVGDFAEARIHHDGGPGKALVIPIGAVLETSTGSYAFVQNASRLLRTEIETGARDGGYIEVTGGIYEGDVVAVKPVETLYLIELRATKGGGHCH